MPRNKSRVEAGWILIAIGAIFLADRLGWEWRWAWHPTVRRLWPVILIVIGLARLQSASTHDQVHGWRMRRRFAGGGWLILIGVMLLLDQNNWLYLSQSWPFFVIAGGLSLLLTRGHDSREGT